MDFRCFLTFLLFSISSASGQSYFSGAFANSIGNISSLIKTIVEKGNQETSHAKRFLSRIIVTATDFPLEPEGSGELPMKKTYIPLSVFQKYAAWYLDSVEEQKVMSEQKTQLGESLRELRMEYVRRKVPMDKYMESVEETEAAVKYNQFEEKMIEVEKNVIKFFTLKKSQLFSSEVHDDIPTLIQELNDLLGEGEIFDLILTKNRYIDDVFVKLYNHFRKYSVFLTVARSIKDIQENSEALRNAELFEEHVRSVTDGYKSFLETVGTANGKREQTSFTFESMFSSEQLSDLTATSVLPVPEHHNLFNFNWDLELFEKNYSLSGDRFVSKEHSECLTTLFRTNLDEAPHHRTKAAQTLRTIAISVLNDNIEYGSHTAQEIVNNDHEHIVICTSMVDSTVADTAFSDDYINKVSVTLEASYEYLTQDYDGQHYDSQKKNGVVQIMGFYLTPKSDLQ